MAICSDCDQEMTTAASCVVEFLLIGDRPFPRRPWTRRGTAHRTRCGDCGAAPGAWHHLGCDMEDCPSCGWQLLSCGCGSRHEDDDAEADDLERELYPLLPREVPQ